MASFSTTFATSARPGAGAALVALVFVFLGDACAHGERAAAGPGPIDAGAGAEDGRDLDAAWDQRSLSGFSCAQAAASKSYIGCDYWPTAVANNVWSIFDYAVVVANAGDEPADVVVTGRAPLKREVTVQPGKLTTIYLPWIPELKGPDANSCGKAVNLTKSVKSINGAFHLVSSRPVSVYQFNALEYKGEGGPRGKNWSSCPGNEFCSDFAATVGCMSFSNDASLLIPSTAMTGHYRITGYHGWDLSDLFGGTKVTGSYFAVTATANGTSVKVRLGAKGRVVPGPGVNATPDGKTLNLTLNAGDVAEVIGEPDRFADFSGSLLEANQPVQVITGSPCMQVPLDTPSCDHIEQSNLPLETWGKDYFVTVPSGPDGKPVGHDVVLYGSVDGTKLTYDPAPPFGAPTVIDAGEVVDLDVVSEDFRVSGTQPFSVGSFQLGSDIVDRGAPQPRGDPSQSLAVSLEQYRERYIFLAPSDYDVSFADVVHPDDVELTLDGFAPAATTTKVGKSGFSVSRITLDREKDGAHELVSSKPVGLQVMGYGFATSYQYPGGLNLKPIAPVPVK